MLAAPRQGPGRRRVAARGQRDRDRRPRPRAPQQARPRGGRLRRSLRGGSLRPRRRRAVAGCCRSSLLRCPWLFPRTARARLRNQLERSATSIVANIAEGAGELSPSENCDR
ncbi:MAG: four helix bundle protein [Sandaracinaceae bacterium]|nr:MAG: four helix bundle protein [Sandaracinaceae bacterium]